MGSLADFRVNDKRRCQSVRSKTNCNANRLWSRTSVTSPSESTSELGSWGEPPWLWGSPLHSDKPFKSSLKNNENEDRNEEWQELNGSLSNYEDTILSEEVEKSFIV